MCLQSILSRSLLILPVLCCLYLFVVSALTPFMTTSSLIPLSLMSCGTVSYRSSPRAEGRFAPVCGTNRCKAHLLCKLDPLSALRSGANWPSFQSHEYTSKGPPDGCCSHSWPSCPGHPSQFKTEASQATDPVIYTLDSCAPSGYVLSPNIVSERRFEGKIGCMGAG